MKELMRAFSPKISSEQLESFIHDAAGQIFRCGNVSELYLFGSAAKNEADPYSDLDFLVVTDTSEEAKRLSSELVRKVRVEGMAVEFVCVDQATFQRKSDLGGVCFVAKHQGRRLLRAHSEPASQN